MGAGLRRNSLMRLNLRPVNLRRAPAFALLFALVPALSLAPGCAHHGHTAAAKSGQSSAQTSPPPLIPRRLVFGNPDRSSVEISPDGRHISFLAPRNGVMNVFVAAADNPSMATPVTNDTTRGIPGYFWAYDSKHVLYIQDKGGNENWNVFSVAVDAPDQATNLTPNEKVAARVAGISERHPESILVAVNDRDPRFHDLYRVDIASGERTLLAQNPGEIEGNTVGQIMADDDYRVRFASASTPDGGEAYYQPSGGADTASAAAPPTDWKLFEKIGSDDTMTT